jgi:NAD(P)-dependent dehydrogenase (short-subunit alcohol dehydrogenase family)
MNQGELDGKVALVTGASGGQGRSHVERFLAEGADVIAVDLKEVDGEPVLESHGDSKLLRADCDVRDSAQLKAVVESAVEQLGKLDIVIANAGVTGTREPAWEIDDDEWDRVIGIDLSGSWRTIKAAAPSLLANDSASVVIIGSTCGVRGYPTMAHYTAAKHGLVGLTRALSAEMAPQGVRVNIVHPTMVDTPMIHTPEMYDAFLVGQEDKSRESFEGLCYGLHQLPIPWVASADVTEMVLFLVSDRARFLTGGEFTVDAGATQKS